MRFVVIGALLLASRTAGATTGGSALVEVLGFDAPDAKIYVVTRFHDESGRLPEVHFVHTAGPRIGKATRVESIVRGLTDSDHEAFDERLAKLRRRLQPLRAMPGALVDPAGDGSRVSPRLGQLLGAKRVTKRTVQVPDWGRGEGTRPCRVVELRLAKGDLAGTIELRDCHPPSTGVVAAFAIPSGGVLAIVSSRPDDFEMGYPVERPLLLRTP